MYSYFSYLADFYCLFLLSWLLEVLFTLKFVKIYRHVYYLKDSIRLLEIRVSRCYT